MINGKRPYIISADIKGLITPWAIKNDYSLPKNSFFKNSLTKLQDVLSDYFDEGVEIIPEERIRHFLIKALSLSKIPVISLDRVYIQSRSKGLIGFLDTTTPVDENCIDIGLFSRNGKRDVETKIQKISGKLLKKGINNIVLADDVVFSGESALKIVHLFSKNGISVSRIIAGVGIGKGVDKLRNEEIEIECAEEYYQVIDELNERDFTAGVPFSGELVIDNKQGKIYSAPFFKPFFAKVTEWTSIPQDKVNDFSYFRLQESIDFWRQIEISSKKEVPIGLLPRQINIDCPSNLSIVKALTKIMVDYDI